MWYFMAQKNKSTMFFQFVTNNNNNSVDLDKIIRGQLDECYSLAGQAPSQNKK